MKFIPIDRFEAINSILNQIPLNPGVSFTVKLEAFTCRHTKEEKHIASELAEHMMQIQSTPPVSPSPGIVWQASGEAPPVLVLGSATAEVSTPQVVEADDVDERLVYCVAALNHLYSDDGYDFNVLQNEDFISHTEETITSEVNFRLEQVAGNDNVTTIHDLWPSIRDVVGRTEDGCEYFQFSCPSCDPMSEQCIDYRTYFLYNKRKKILVSLRMGCRSV